MMKKIHTHLLLLYRHYLANSLSRYRYRYVIILAHLSMMQFYYSQSRRETALTQKGYRAKPCLVVTIEERTGL